jgi:hypothetical protein
MNDGSWVARNTSFLIQKRQFKMLALQLVDVPLVGKTLVKDVCVALVKATKNVRPIAGASPCSRVQTYGVDPGESSIP